MLGNVFKVALGIGGTLLVGQFLNGIVSKNTESEKRKPNEEVLITGNDYCECANKLSDLLHRKTDISSLHITFLGKGDEVLSDVIRKIKTETILCVHRDVKVEWETGPNRFAEAAISVVISY